MSVTSAGAFYIPHSAINPLLGATLPIRWHGIKSILEQEFLYTGAHNEIEKRFRDTKGCIPTRPHHRSANRQRFRLRTVCGCNKCRLNSSFQLAFLILGVESL